MDNNFNRVRLCGRAAGEPELSHINHGESFYRFPLSVERLSGQEDRLPVILPRPLLECGSHRKVFPSFFFGGMVGNGSRTAGRR